MGANVRGFRFTVLEDEDELNRYGRGNERCDL